MSKGVRKSVAKKHFLRKSVAKKHFLRKSVAKNKEYVRVINFAVCFCDTFS